MSNCDKKLQTMKCEYEKKSYSTKRTLNNKTLKMTNKYIVNPNENNISDNKSCSQSAT